MLCGAVFVGCAHNYQSAARNLPIEDVSFLCDMTRDVVNASRVKPGSNGGGNCPFTNTCGFTLVTPGKDTYQAFWPRDFSMALGSGFISAEDMRNHLRLLCRVQNGATDKKLAHRLHVPPSSIPDHVNYDGRPVWFPGTMNSGDDQGNGMCGRIPPLDDNFEFIHIAFVLWQTTHDSKFLSESINGLPVFERLKNAFDSVKQDSATGLVETSEDDRGVGFGFCDAEAHTGKLLFASLLRFRAANEMAQLERAVKFKMGVSEYSRVARKIRANIAPTFKDPVVGGWLRASTGLSKQADVWGTLYALELGVLDKKSANAARSTVANAVRSGTITFEGGARHVPTDFDFSATTSWERSISPLNTYQNGGYWHTASGWLIDVLWAEDRSLALNVFNDMIAHLRKQDFRK
ncbi:MAG: hypothetical protein ACXWDN_19240, partial [Limisphaerales bacterium]